MDPGSCAVLDESGLTRLFENLKTQGYEIVGPTVRDGAIVYDTLASIHDLPRGVSDEQRGGRYRLGRRDDDALFGYVVGPHSWKRFLYPPLLTLWRARRAEHGFDVSPPAAVPRYALFGVRACELAAIAIQDRVLAGGPYSDPTYKARRDAAFIVAVSCERAGDTCFCASLRTGPRVTTGFDLALTEILEGGHRFLVETGSMRGVELAAGLPTRPAASEDTAAADALLARAEAGMGRALDTAGLKELLYRNYESPRWEEVAKRCLTCANCTMVCPTCFCASVDDVSDLSGSEAERRRHWDSCFTMDFSYIHGGSVRTSAGARYRQWMTHKFATWQDQFGSLGCVGCGRCITWCPVGIDVTEELAGLRQGEARGR
jgi:sulfhydrogenase subunit beta (sulfur reductase)